MRLQSVNSYTNKQTSPNFGSAAKLAGKILNENSAIGKFAKNISYDGLDMSFPVMIAAMLGGVLVPRLIQAQDKYDRQEILRRDITSEGTIVFGAAALSKLFLKHNEKKSGFVLMKKPENFSAKSKFKKFMDYFMPTSTLTPANSGQIISRYSNIDAPEDGKGILHFCDYITDNGGNLNKLFHRTDATKEILSDICGSAEAFKQADDKSIKSYISRAMEEAPEKISKLYDQFKGENNEFVKQAKAMNSKFKFLSIFILIPAILGFGLPAMNEALTKKKYKKEHSKENAPATTVEAVNTQAANTNTPAATGSSTTANSTYQTYKNPYFMAIPEQKNSKTKKIFDKISSR